MYNRKRREKLADLFFDLVKFILTVGVIGSLITGTFKPIYAITGLITSTFLVVFAYFLIPKDKEE
ncbi:MAG: hypothetical protein AB1414_10595 [bacterium]